MFKIPNNTTNNDNRTTINNNIIINFSQDNYEIITKEFLEKILTNDMEYNEFVRTIIGNVTTESQNYKITNLRSKYALAYENGKYIKVLREPATSTFIYKIGERLIENIPNRRNVQHFIHEDDEEIVKETRDMVEVEVYNATNKL